MCCRVEWELHQDSLLLSASAAVQFVPCGYQTVTCVDLLLLQNFGGFRSQSLFRLAREALFANKSGGAIWVSALLFCWDAVVGTEKILKGVEYIMWSFFLLLSLPLQEAQIFQMDYEEKNVDFWYFTPSLRLESVQHVSTCKSVDINENLKTSLGYSKQSNDLSDSAEAYWFNAYQPPMIILQWCPNTSCRARCWGKSASWPSL